LGPETTFGRYRLDERLSPDGATWAAEDLDAPSSMVAVKILPEGTDVISARHIGDLLESVDDPHVNPLSDEGEMPDGRPFLVYPVVEGITLREFMNQSGPLPLSVAGLLISQIGQALEALHSRKVIYGILSPEHVMVQQIHGHLRAVLLNAGVFGLQGQSSASPGYVAPEQAAGNPLPASDMFSLGAIAAEMLTGKRAFRYGSLADLQRIQRIGIPRGALRKLRSRIPLRVEEEIRRATAWDPAQRPSDSAVFGSRIAEFLGTGGNKTRRLVIVGLLAAAASVLGLRRCGRLPR